MDLATNTAAVLVVNRNLAAWQLLLRDLLATSRRISHTAHRVNHDCSIPEGAKPAS